MLSSAKGLLLGGSLLTLFGSIIPVAQGLAAAAVDHHGNVARERISSYNISFDSPEFDNLGDLDWRPISSPFQGLSWNQFRVGANKHFFQTAGGKDAFAAIPLDIMTQEILHTADPSLSCKYNDSDITSFGLGSLSFGCALHSGIPVECSVDFKALNAAGKEAATYTSKFSPPYARMNELGRLEAGKANLQNVHFDPRKFGAVSEVQFIVKNFSVLYLPPVGMEAQQPLDVSYSDSLLFVIDGISYNTNSTLNKVSSPTNTTPSTGPVDGPKPTELLKRGGSKYVTDCYDLDGDVTYNSFPIPYKDLFYDGFYRVKHLTGFYKSDCGEGNLNASTGHIYAPGIGLYSNENSTGWPSIGIDYHGSTKKDMAIRSFYLGCEQFIDDETVLDTEVPCVIGVLSFESQKKGDRPQKVHYQEVSIAPKQGNLSEDATYQHVELKDGHHVTQIYFVPVSLDPNAKVAAILLDNLTYHTRKGKGPRTGNKQIAPSEDKKVNEILKAIALSKVRSISSQGQPGISTRGNKQNAVNITFTFDNIDQSSVDKATGNFPITAALTNPFTFGPGWTGRAQDAQGNPARDVYFNNETWPFAPVDPARTKFAYVELPWSNRGTNEWSTAGRVISLSQASGYSSFTIKRMTTSCYPVFLTDEDRKRIQIFSNDFECHFTVLGFKKSFTEEPAEHAIDFSVGGWKNWVDDKFPRNFDNVNLLEFHVTYASTRNVRILVDNIEIEVV
ncbi:hypothetical protein ABW19_dt0202259 [Dactylella cylindrospora]|nr:hypothetical protein ABW19_dt0202259 [Dactylella cylindrospora]